MEIVTKGDIINHILSAVRSNEFGELIKAWDSLFIAHANSRSENLAKKIKSAMGTVKYEINKLLSIEDIPVCIEDFDDNFNTCDVVTEKTFVSVLMAFDYERPWEKPIVLSIYAHLGKLVLEVWSNEES